MNILVTGANGFVGRALCETLVKRGHFVRAAARDFKDLNLPAGSMEKFPVPGISGKTQWSAALKDVDVVIHLAARVHVMRDEASDPLAAFREVNVDGTLCLAQQAVQAGVRRFIFLSSIKVNGEASPPGRPFRPDDAPAPEDAYALSKLEGEQALAEVCAETGTEFVVIRPPLVYGPGVGGNFRAMLRWMRYGIPLPFGAVNNRRSLIALDNLIDLCAICVVHPAAANQVFLAADGEDVSTTELLLKIAHAYGQSARLFPLPTVWLQRCAALLGKRGVAERVLGSLVVDSAKASELLDWHPVVSMDEQLRKMARDDPNS